MMNLINGTIALLLLGALPVLAQPVTSESPNALSSCVAQARDSANPTARLTALARAKHLARQAAEAANGGLVYYRAEAAMHAPIAEAPCTDAGDGHWTFVVQGRRLQPTPAVVRTVVRVDQATAAVTIAANEVQTVGE